MYKILLDSIPISQLAQEEKMHKKMSELGDLIKRLISLGAHATVLLCFADGSSHLFLLDIIPKDIYLKERKNLVQLSKCD